MIPVNMTPEVEKQLEEWRDKRNLREAQALAIAKKYRDVPALLSALDAAEVQAEEGGKRLAKTGRELDIAHTRAIAAERQAAAMREENARLREIVGAMTEAMETYCVLRSTDGQIRKCICCAGLGRGDNPVKHTEDCPLRLAVEAMRDPNLTQED